MNQSILIVGAGLGGCYLAERLHKHFDVTMVELPDQNPLLRDRILDVASPAVTYPNLESGYGGTTKAWHNALMEIDDRIFESKWPFSKELLIPYYEEAYRALSGTTRESVFKFASELKAKLVGLGFPENLLTQNMFIPKTRVNAWNNLKLKDKVSTIDGEASELIPDDKGGVERVEIRLKDGTIKCVRANYYVLAAGGLGTPLLLQKFAVKAPSKALKNAGFHYEDHPIAFVAEVELNGPLYKLWDFPIKTKSGNANIRFPFSMYWNGLNISFQLRPAHHLRLSKPRTKVVSILNDLRNFPFKLKNYFRLLSQLDDICDILSFKFGLRIPTRHYSVLMIAEQPPTSYCAVWRARNESNINRRWEIDGDYIKDLNGAINSFLGAIQPITKKVTQFNNWPSAIYSSSHHSGTARISSNPNDGVCDENGLVYGVSNLLVCDGSIIPASGFVNTGLTIVALALRQGDFLLKLKSSNIG